MESTIKEICETDTGNDFVKMEVLGTKEITPEKKYPGIGINLLAKIKNVRIPFSVDIGVDDVIIPGAVSGVEPYKEGCKHINLAVNVCGYTPINLGKIIKEGVLSDISDIHRMTIDEAKMRKGNKIN